MRLEKTIIKKSYMKTVKACVLICVSTAIASLAFGQEEPPGQPVRSLHYKNPTAYGRIRESMGAHFTTADAQSGMVVAIRICSQQPIPQALLQATANPFVAADLLVHEYAFPTSAVVYLFSRNCLPPGSERKSLTEVWKVAPQAMLPEHEAQLGFDQVAVIPLGKDDYHLGMRDYTEALRKLVPELKENPGAFGVIIGFYLEQPSPLLRRRVRASKQFLKTSRIKKTRYSVALEGWPDETSLEVEPVYPSIYVLRIQGVTSYMPRQRASI